jgi:hypothetical protein
VGDGGLTVHDNVTGLTWTRSPDLDRDGDIDVDDKLTFDQAETYADTTLNAENFAGYGDWRLPSIKELYSLMDFGGSDPPPDGSDTSGLQPFIDTDYFEFGYGDTAAGERLIDAQFWSSNQYVDNVFGNQEAAFGLNLADGRIKGYPSGSDGPVTKLNYVYFVRGNTEYGLNDFQDNGDGTITDRATGLMWSKDDSGEGMDWEDALAWVQQKNAENYLGHNDWRLPDAKELQSIVDYSRSPDTTDSPALDPVFNATGITNLAGQADYGFYWTGTTHVRADGNAGAAAYVAFGRGLGSMDGTTVLDVHGAGCQRSDPKAGDPADYPVVGHGPQGDVQRVFNFVRLVRDAEIDDPPTENLPPTAEAGGPYEVQQGETLTLDGSVSTDADGTIVSYAWDLDGDGQFNDATGPSAEYLAEATGTFTVGLQVTDDQGAEHSDTAVVEVLAAPDDPGSVVDDGDEGFGRRGRGWRHLSFGHDGDSLVAGRRFDRAVASWNFDVEPGEYEVLATWTARAHRNASNAPYTVFDGRVRLGTERVDQRVDPPGPQQQEAEGPAWQSLGTYQVRSGRLHVDLTTHRADGDVVADAVRVVRRGPLEEPGEPETPRERPGDPGDRPDGPNDRPERGERGGDGSQRSDDPLDRGPGRRPGEQKPGEQPNDRLDRGPGDALLGRRLAAIESAAGNRSDRAVSRETRAIDTVLAAQSQWLYDLG